MTAFRAAVERPAAPFVRTALRAADERWEAVRREAPRLACADSALRDTVLRGSRSSTFETARETFGWCRVVRLC
jgi:hypothetical protein